MSELSRLTAQDIMTKEVISLRPEMLLRQAAQIFTDCKISGAPVLNKDSEIVGVLSQTDLLAYSVAAENSAYFHNGYYYELPLVGQSAGISYEKFDSTKVEDIMSPHVITAPPNESLSGLARCLREHRFHRIIIAENKLLVGIVTTLDLLQILENLEH